MEEFEVKKEIYIPSKNFGFIYFFINISLLFLITTSIFNFINNLKFAIQWNKYLKELSQQLKIQLSFVNTTNIVVSFFASMLALLVALIIINYLIITISSNIQYLRDISTILSKTGVIDKGIKAISKGKEEFDSQEFRELEIDLDVVSYCRCGMQLFEEDDVCPNCGKKVNKK